MTSCRMLGVVLFGVAISWLAFLANSNWPTVQLVTRLLRGPPPMDPSMLMKLVQSTPDSELSRVVILSIPPKMGTTWVGHIAHQLVSHGREIDATRNLQLDSPYPESAAVFVGTLLHEMNPPYWRREPFASYPAGPITIRTHTKHAALVTSGLADRFRLVTVLRDPCDTILSSWRFIPSVAGLDHNLIPIEHIVTLFSLSGELDSVFADYADFYERRHDPNILLLFFDDLNEDLAGSVRRLARHLAPSPPLTEAELQLVTAQSTHKYMTSPERETRFNDMPATARRRMMDAMGLTEEDMYSGARVEVVRKAGGKSGEGRAALPDNVKRKLDDLWAKHVLPRTSCTSLEDMRLKFKAEREAQKTKNEA